MVTSPASQSVEERPAVRDAWSNKNGEPDRTAARRAPRINPNVSHYPEGLYGTSTACLSRCCGPARDSDRRSFDGVDDLVTAGVVVVVEGRGTGDVPCQARLVE